MSFLEEWWPVYMFAHLWCIVLSDCLGLLHNYILEVCYSVFWKLSICIFRDSFVEELKLHQTRGRNFCRDSSRCSNRVRVRFLACLPFLEEITSSFRHSSKIHSCSRCFLMFMGFLFSELLPFSFQCVLMIFVFFLAFLPLGKLIVFSINKK